MPDTTTPSTKTTDTTDPGGRRPEAACDPTGRKLPPTSGADAIVLRWTKIGAGLAILPVPLLDFATTSGCALKMLHSLARYYGVEFRGHIGKSAVTALLGGASAPLATAAAYSLVRVIPIVGVPLAAAASPALAGSLIYAIGRVFTAHFGSGGTFLDFDPEKFRDYFQAQVEAGRTVLKDLKGKAPQ
ncbi:YcjF family protein [Nannocystis punicea]|uniref:DUF697 domain-containing protein n=1 Tax=Nannocystis punicea TaxID=2995304 RepID=A0ABY7GX99_9BACT|nr:DUF697 domain-containing protein [Nannocystis poenicansa]WAS91504.1 DUF697 domain-containing protein [Nannocystis poenicansa]